MRITALVENTTNKGLRVEHGLSFYIETAKHKLLFDVGASDALIENAKTLNIDLSSIDTLIISHGHGDHGSGLSHFLAINRSAKIYIQESAFDPHYSRFGSVDKYIGIDSELKDHSQISILNGDFNIDDELSLFTVTGGDRYRSTANDTLYDGDGQDKFLHEQNLIIMDDGKVALIMGCGHVGVVNIMDKAKAFTPSVCIGGYHLYHPGTKKSQSPQLVADIAKELSVYSNTQFYTCHCTGVEAYELLSKRMSNISYIACGDTVEV